uniref:Uncharacterized protein n=2 Tax=Picea TaxID=3328 RepID=A0A101M0U2_PICGL|nr:hypothetical protein ABT39_MTgene4146 [Picea glauca]QHR90346.1 hypothetical protein Q903MT_gene4369 [Picea sitchensis]
MSSITPPLVPLYVPTMLDIQLESIFSRSKYSCAPSPIPHLFEVRAGPLSYIITGLCLLINAFRAILVNYPFMNQLS